MSALLQELPNKPLLATAYSRARTTTLCEMRLTHLITLSALTLALVDGCHPRPAPSMSQSFWEQVRSGEVRNFMVYGFKVGVRPDSYWPVAANIFVPTARLEEAKQAREQLQPIIASRLVGLEKDDITQPERRARLEQLVLADMSSRLPELAVKMVFLSLDIK